MSGRRIRRLGIALAVLAAVVPATAAAATAPTGAAHLTLSPAARFPQRQFTLSLPPGVSPLDVQVTENGVPVIAHLTPIANESAAMNSCAGRQSEPIHYCCTRAALRQRMPSIHY